MKKTAPILKILIFLLAIHTFNPTVAQETMYEMLDVMDLPPELNPKWKTSCSLEFQEQWILNVGKASISKVVNAYEISCKDSTDVPGLPEGVIRLKNLSYEFSFLEDSKLQEAMIALINDRYPLPEVYNPREQLLSVYFHEDWILDPDHQVFKKTVRGITPVIWQERRTAEGEALHDAETGYPVYYKLKLERIDLRQP